MNSKEFSSNKKNKFAKQTTQNLKICEKNSTFYDSVTENLNLKSCQNLSFLALGDKGTNRQTEEQKDILLKIIRWRNKWTDYHIPLFMK